MDLSSFDQYGPKKSRLVTQILLISGLLNILLLGACFYLFLKEDNPAVSLPKRLKPAPPIEHPTLQKIFTEYSQLPFIDLVPLLMKKEHIEQGVNKRDIALACLTNFHHFYLEKALGSSVFQKRRVQIFRPESHEQLECTLVTGLAEEQFQAIIHFARTERWPLTPEGLFYEIQAGTSSKDPTIFDAFFMTPHCYFAYHLFSRSGLTLSKEMLIQLLSEGNWNILKELAEDIKLTSDFSIEKRRHYLMRFLANRSVTAARLLVQYDYDFVLVRLDDQQLCLLLSVLSTSTPITLAKQILASPRSDVILKMAAALLYCSINEAIPETIDLRKAKEIFLPKEQKIETKTQITKQTTQKNTERIHIVQKNENLWKIARKYKVTIEGIMKANQLENDRLKPMQKLLIPNPKE